MVLVGYWPFNESSGTTAYDHSGRENHGALNGDVSPGSQGVLSESSYSFDGSNDYVGLGGTSQLDFGNGSLTITAWFRTPENSQQGKIVNRGQSGAFPSSSGYSLRFYDKYGVAFTDGSNNSSVYVDSASKVSQNEWHLGAGVLDRGREKAILYLDDELIGTSDASSLGSISNSDATTDIGVLNRGSYGDNSEFFNGKLQEVRIHNHALTRREIQYLYTVGRRGRQVTLRKRS